MTHGCWNYLIGPDPQRTALPLPDEFKRFEIKDEPLADWEKELLARDPFETAVHAVFQEARDLLLLKHQDYGPKNISQSPGGPLNGLRVRMHDKTARLNHLIDSGNEPNHESIEDTLIDLANYALIGILVLRGQWPSE